MIELRDYQKTGVARIRHEFARCSRRVLFVLPTGGGKTIVFVHICSRVASKGKRVVILVHRVELIDQVSATLGRFGVDHGVIAAGHPETDKFVQIASVATLARRLNRVRPFDLVIVDEAHHATAGTWAAIMAAMPDAFALGVSATPERLDGRGLGVAFDVMVQGPTAVELTKAGHLVPARVFAPPERIDLSAVRLRAGDYDARQLAELMSDGAIVGNVVAHWQRLAAGVPTIAFCASIEHSKQVADQFHAAGIPAAHVDGATPPEERRQIVAALGVGDLKVLCNVDLFGEGVDVPGVGAVILLRPTRSLARYLQAVGRALRPDGTKDHALVLDHAGCSWQHGLPDAPRAWTLEDRPARRATERTDAPGEQLRQCGGCGAFHGPATPTCSTCGEPLGASPAEVREVEAQLEEQRRERQRKAAERITRMRYAELIEWANSLDKLQFAARVKGYHHGWIKRRLEELEKREPID